MGCGAVLGRETKPREAGASPMRAKGSHSVPVRTKRNRRNRSLSRLNREPAVHTNRRNRSLSRLNREPAFKPTGTNRSLWFHDHNGIRVSNTQTHTHTHTRDTHAHTRAHTHARAHTRTRTHTHIHTHWCTVLYICPIKVIG